MGFLLKEVLKTLCGASQWCYAVFWKIGCQNPNLLIWEESHYEPMSIPRSGLLNQFAIPAGDPIQTLIKKMIMDNQVYVVGEGVVGRSAFTGEHQWIFSSNYIRHAHPPEVSNELHYQFLAGMQTVAVVPVLPHGVVQLGSPFVIQENTGFLNEVKSLILQFGCVPGALLFDHYPTKVSTQEINSTPSAPSSLASRPVCQSYYPLMRQAQENVFTTASTTQASNLVQMSSKAQDNHGQWSSSLDACVQSSSGDDLFDMLGLGYKNKILNGNYHGLIDNELVATPHNMLMETSTSSFMTMHNAGTDHLLDAVVSKAQSFTKQSSDDSVSCSTTVTKISSSAVPNASPTYGQGIELDQAFGFRDTLLKPGYGKDDDPGSCSQTSYIYGSQISSWVERGHNVKHDTSVSSAFSKKTGDTCKPNRKRLKPGENPKPRPKDRQMIQDRVKELREIVPNGAKCSIDALLERTIKHMLFLQSVTKHADKLKQTGEFKIASKEGGLLLRDNFDGGATWAFEVGSQSMVCPIIVEDLDSPRQMLVEMLCEERGVFLEVADLIKGLGLTILKGVMEARDDKIWARFVVEADRDMTRMEIFMSLVRFLEQTGKGNTSSTDSIDSNNMIVHNSFPQVASIPATGQTH